MKKTKTIRITLDLREPAYDRLCRVEDLVGAETKAEVLRDALRLYEYVARRTAAGDQIKIVRPDGSEQNLVLFVAVGEPPERAGAEVPMEPEGKLVSGYSR